MSFELEIFPCADMFPNEDFKTVSVCPCPYPEKRNRPGFINISPTVENGHQWKGLDEYYSMETKKKLILVFEKVRNWILTCAKELKSPWLRQYQSYISNWYINGKVFTSTTAWKTKNLNFFSKKVEIEFWLLLKSWNHLSFGNVSPTLVIDTSMERSSRVLQHGNPKIGFFSFQKSSKLNFDSCWRDENPLASSISVLY